MSHSIKYCATELVSFRYRAKDFSKSLASEEKREKNMPIAISNHNNTPTLGASSLASTFKQISGTDGLGSNASATNLTPRRFTKAKAQETAPAADPNVLKAVMQVIRGLVQLMGASTAQAPESSEGIQLNANTPSE